MKKIFLIVAILSASFCALAQKPSEMTMECFYRLTFQKDTIENITKEDVMVLRMNRSRSVFFSENSYRLDSLLLSEQGDAVRMDILANGAKKYDRGAVSYCVLKEFSDNSLTFTDNVGGDYLKYQEAMPRFDWKLTGEQKQVGGYACQKATCEFRGRNYEAWFTTEIPMNNGPWKFNGLPGLILEVYDTAWHYHFEFLSMSQSEAEIGLLTRDYTKTTREKFLKAQTNYIKNPVDYIAATSGMKISLSGNAKAKMKAKGVRYDLMELF